MRRLITLSVAVALGGLVAACGEEQKEADPYVSAFGTALLYMESRDQTLLTDKNQQNEIGLCIEDLMVRFPRGGSVGNAAKLVAEEARAKIPMDELTIESFMDSVGDSFHLQVNVVSKTHLRTFVVSCVPDDQKHFWATEIR